MSDDFDEPKGAFTRRTRQALAAAKRIRVIATDHDLGGGA